MSDFLSRVVINVWLLGLLAWSHMVVSIPRDEVSTRVTLFNEHPFFFKLVVAT